MRLVTALMAAVGGFAALVAAPAVMPGAQADDEALWALMKEPGHIVLLRHSNAPEQPPDADKVDVKDCTTQRNLDDAGRAQARRVGEMFRQHGIKAARLVSSQYCRAIETAKLTGLGPVQELPALNMVYIGNLSDMAEAGQKGRQFMKTIPTRQFAILVSHVPNLLAISGVNLGSGEMAVVHVDASGNINVDGRIVVH